MKKPGFWQLCKAYVVDFASVSILSSVVIGLLYRVVFAKKEGFCGILKCFRGRAGVCVPWCSSPQEHRYFEAQIAELWWLFIVVPFVLLLCYFIFSDGKFGKTLGKYMAGVKVISKDGMQAPVYKSILAYLVDFLLLALVTYGISTEELGHTLINTLNLPPYAALSAWIFSARSVVTMLILGALYFIVCEARWGKTLGKKLTGLQVVQTEKGE